MHSKRDKEVLVGEVLGPKERSGDRLQIMSTKARQSRLLVVRICWTHHDEATT